MFSAASPKATLIAVQKSIQSSTSHTHTHPFLNPKCES